MFSCLSWMKRFLRSSPLEEAFDYICGNVNPRTVTAPPAV